MDVAMVSEMADRSSADRGKLDDEHVIVVEGLQKRYGDLLAVADVSLRVAEGEVFGLVGPNGAGKTTTVACIVGLRQPDAGHLRVLGLDPVRDGRRLREDVGVQLQASRLPDALRVGEALDLYASFYAEPAEPAELLARLGLTRHIRTAFSDLSGGLQQRVSIALALVGSPRITVLDELTTGLDPQARRDAWQLVEMIRDAGVTVLVVTHLIEEAERLCDRLAIIDHGRVVACGSPDELVETIDARHHLRLCTSSPLDLEHLQALPAVTRATAAGDEVLIEGGGDVLLEVAGWLNGSGVAPRTLRYGEASLEDAFIQLTGSGPDASHHHAEEGTR